jgi:putative adenylate-forming enzyme
VIAAAGRQAVGRYLRWRVLHLDAERLRAHQARRVRAQLAYVRRHSPYYAELLPADGPLRLADVPPIDKAEMMRSFDRITTADLRRDELVAFRIDQERRGATDLYRGRYSVGLSSGTSGNKVLTVLSPKERARYAALLWARSGIPHELSRPRVLFCLRTNNPAFTAVTAFGVELIYVDYLTPVEELLRLIALHRLEVLAGPPSVLGLLAEVHERIPHPIRAVLSYAEELDEASRVRLAAAFTAPVVELYQGAEGMLAFTCPAGTLHLNEDVTLMQLGEAVDEGGRIRRAIVTDLYRRTQPFLRYELGDLIELDPTPCPCGSAFRRLKRIHGRSDAVLALAAPGGGTIRLMPDHVRRSINQASDDVLEYQVIQWALDDLELRLRVKDGADRVSIEATVAANLARWAERAGGVLPRLRFTVTEPERHPVSHKLIRVQNRIPS